MSKIMDKIRPNSTKGINVSGENALKNVLRYIKSREPYNIRKIISLEDGIDSSRTEYLNSWVESINELQNKLQNLKLEVRNDFTMEKRDAEYYRVRMFELEEKISEVKENIKNELCSLLKEEQELNKELQIAERRIEEWGKTLSLKSVKPPGNIMQKVQKEEDEKDPLGDFQKFLSSFGGHYGGWEEQDHLLFLRERRKYNGKPKFLLAVQSLLQDINYEEIEAHENWYKKYESLKALQKEAIKKWRASKSFMNEQLVAKSEQVMEIENKKIKNVTYQRDIVERIKQWKKQQQIKKAEQEEREKKEQQILAQEKMKKRELQKAKKLAVEQYRAEKISKIQNELLASQKIKELQAIEDRARKNILLKTFREQDKQYIERIKSLRGQSASAAKDRLEKLENIKPATEIAVERDRRRLLKPTQVWNQHCLPEENYVDKSSKIFDLQAIPHLATPSWRKGLSHI